MNKLVLKKEESFSYILGEKEKVHGDTEKLQLYLYKPQQACKQCDGSVLNP
ncbi:MULTISPECIES: hypothetical protein [Okeania]|uniref:hypothetical protein n=1 Tax=Okeania TaxID=1458928 RepID=UPI00137508AE|nr:MULTISPECIES: hypothetical protein [Okeania]NET15731.1 hypothetical protein [Okeania sp. SIO1H6]NES77863.1 hypothetical protein [Okeania sp. SIO1H4]NES91909.1 hypothetical protein [Okeania sp. SIO2B9]NET20079.1 hypothetical protein [Okeania sp. SIO1H5]NET76732.1 hypothetical protein [Okeania sp. SIO1F9]